MRREHLAFLLGGFAFGALFGFALYYAIDNRPALPGASASAESVIEGPRGPKAPTQVSAGDAGGAPMMRRINDLKRVLAERPDDIAAVVELASIYQQVAMWDQAAGFYERALELGEEHPQVLINLGLCYRGQGEYDRALEMFGRAHDSDPSHWQALFNTVIVAATDVQRFEVAFDALETIESIAPPPAGLDPAQLRQLRDWLEKSRAEHQQKG